MAETKEAKRRKALETHILDIPKLSSYARANLISSLCDPQTRSEVERATGAWRGARFLEGFRDLPGLTLADLIRRWPWGIPWSEGPVRKFALSHGLSRVDWLLLPYVERTVMKRLCSMSREELLEMPILVFGFLDWRPARRWVFGVCNVRLDEELPYYEAAQARRSAATISRFLSSSIPLERTEAASKSFARLRHALRRLGFSPKEYPVLLPPREAILQSLMREDGLSRRMATRFVEAALRRGWLPKRALK